jgi:hypothetical protein
MNIAPNKKHLPEHIVQHLHWIVETEHILYVQQHSSNTAAHASEPFFSGSLQFPWYSNRKQQQKHDIGGHLSHDVTYLNILAVHQTVLWKWEQVN